MKVVTRLSDLRGMIGDYRRDSRSIGFVPTMGALHEGHLSLVRISRKHAQRCVVSIFVNPTQFGPQEDFGAYPRTPERDFELLAGEGVDVLLMPDAAEVYPEGWAIQVDPGPVGKVFEGAIRPGHFAGVLTVVAKLFHMVQPDVAVFGQKDAQQLFLIRRMVADLNFPVQIVEGDTVREADGLALSSRNAYLSPVQRAKATVLFRALCAGKEAVESTAHSLRRVQEAMAQVTAAEPDFSLDYATAVSDASFSEEDPLPKPARLIIAGCLGPVRLMDNLRID
ncbi:MAG: pantoate--beta-alanine ligase [bacterium]|nr:pantoate--beta-alanine ligase [bacterium]